MRFLLKLQHRYLSNTTQLVNERGVDQGSSKMPLGGFDKPYLNNMPDIKFDALSDRK